MVVDPTGRSNSRLRTRILCPMIPYEDWRFRFVELNVDPTYIQIALASWRRAITENTKMEENGK